MDGAASDEDVVYHRVEAHAVRRDDGVCATESDRKSDDDTRDTWEGGGGEKRTRHKRRWTVGGKTFHRIVSRGGVGSILRLVLSLAPTIPWTSYSTHVRVLQIR